MKFWMFILNLVFAAILGGIISAVNGGTKMEAVLLCMLFLIWFEIRDKE
jgi:hypothetical protein